MVSGSSIIYGAYLCLFCEKIFEKVLIFVKI